MGDKVVVLGSNSFSGAHFVRGALEQGMTVVGLSRSKEPDPVFLPYKWENQTHLEKFSFYQYDLNHDLDAIDTLINDLQPEYVVNFASQSMVAQSWETPLDWFMTNTLSTVLFHDRLRKCPFLKKYVHISTPEVYGANKDLITENENYLPSTPYAVSRAAADMSLKTFYDNYGFPVVFTRAANVYGPGQQLYRIVPRAVLYFKLKKKLQLHGGGHSVRSFIHISDVVKGTIKAMRDAKPGQIFHFSTKEHISIRSLIETIARLMDVSFDELVETAQERPGKDAAYLLDSQKAISQLGWDETVSLEDGIQQVIDWVENNLETIKEQPMDYIHKA